MPVIHDLICSACDYVMLDASSEHIGAQCICGGVYEIYYANWYKRNAVPLHPKDSVTVYQHPRTGKVLYPGRNDVPMPERYRAQGYERLHLRSLHEIDHFSRQHGVVNEAAHYDPGSGRAYDDEPGRRR